MVKCSLCNCKMDKYTCIVPLKLKLNEILSGNDAIHYLTAQGNYRLRIMLTDWSHVTKYALYTTFRVDDETHVYKLTVGGFTGNAGKRYLIKVRQQKKILCFRIP